MISIDPELAPHDAWLTPPQATDPHRWLDPQRESRELDRAYDRLAALVKKGAIPERAWGYAGSYSREAVPVWAHHFVSGSHRALVAASPRWTETIAPPWFVRLDLVVNSELPAGEVHVRDPQTRRVLARIIGLALVLVALGCARRPWWEPRDAAERALLLRHGEGDAGMEALARHRGEPPDWFAEEERALRGHP